MVYSDFCHIHIFRYSHPSNSSHTLEMQKDLVVVDEEAVDSIAVQYEQKHQCDRFLNSPGSEDIDTVET